MERPGNNHEGLIQYIRELPRPQKIAFLANAFNLPHTLFETYDDERLNMKLMDFIQRKKSREAVEAKMRVTDELRGITRIQRKVSGAYRAVSGRRNYGNSVFLENLRERGRLANEAFKGKTRKTG